MEIVKRGYEPKDAIEFGSKAAEKLNAAGQELVFLLNRGYDVKSASTFIGNHHLLSERQRLALARITSTEAALMERRRKELTQAPEELVFDGFNTIITLEVALSGSLLLAGMDGTIRDLAGLRGTYRIVDKTVRAVELLFAHLDELGVKKALFYLVSRYPTPDASECCCWIRQGIMRWRSRRSCTPVWTVCSPAWNGWSQRTPLFWIKRALFLDNLRRNTQ